MALTDYTTYDEVRATLGVSLDEIKDTTLGLPLYADYLLTELDDVHTSIRTEYATIVGIAEISRTAVQAKFYRTVRLFSNFATAKQLTTSLPLFSPKDISDGKATMGRYADSPYRSTIKRINEEYDRFRNKLLEALNELTSTGTQTAYRSYLLTVGTTPDPVTGS